MKLFRVIYDLKKNENNEIKEIKRDFSNFDDANAYFQEIKLKSFSKPIIQILDKKLILV